MLINPEYVIIGKFFSLSSENKQTNKQTPGSLCEQSGTFPEPGTSAANTEEGHRAEWVGQSWTLNQAAHLSYASSPLRDLRLNLSVLLIKWGRILTVSYLRGLSYR